MMKLILFLLTALLLSSCDAYVSLPYIVTNKTSRPVKVFVPGYHADGSRFGKGVDTTLEIGPHASQLVSSTLPRISGLIRPAQKRIYREFPGVCGLKLVKPDTTIEVACSRKEWKFRRGASVLKIRR